MRFLDTTTGEFVERDPRRTRYAILSHTWGKGEQTYEELKRIQQRYAGVPPGSQNGSSGGHQLDNVHEDTIFLFEVKGL